jgi:GNAT superfamily N-acetyltransferase
MAPGARRRASGAAAPAPGGVVCRPLTAERWGDLEALFGPRGACAGCWCMFFRLTRKQFDAGKDDGNRARLRELVDSGAEPGLLAYDPADEAGGPIGWVALAPRSEYTRLDRSRILAPVDERPVWSVTCFYVRRGHRRRGVTVALLEAAARHAAGRGARVLEGYPVDPKAGKTADTFAYHGLASAFRGAGFTEVARRSETRPIMRRELTPLAGKARR